MRTVRPVIAGLLGLMVATFAGVPAASAASTATLTLTPSHGQSNAPFTVAYQEPVRLLLGSCPSSVTFTYDGAALGDAPLARKGSSCVATLSTSPAPGSAPGAHTVRVTDRSASASATYTVDPAPSPAPPSPTRASPTPSPTRPPSASPSDVSGAQPAVPSATGGDSSGPPSPGALAGMPGRSTSDGGSATPWVIGGGALFILADLAILALLGRRGRRGGRLGRRQALPDS